MKTNNEILIEKSKRVFPSTEAHTIDGNIVPENIKKGVSILGVDGEYEAPEPDYTYLKWIQTDGNCAYVLDTSVAVQDNFPEIYKTYQPMRDKLVNVAIDYTLDLCELTTFAEDIFLGGYSYDKACHLAVGIDAYEENFIMIVNNKKARSSYSGKDSNNTRRTAMMHMNAVDKMAEVYAGVSAGRITDAYNGKIDAIMLFAYDFDDTNGFNYYNDFGFKINSININTNQRTSDMVSWNFIPVKRKDGQVGFLETNSGTFCPNLGTGTPLYETF